MSHTTWVLYALISFYFLLDRGRPRLFGALSGLFFGLALNTRTIETVVLIPAWGVVLLAYLAPREGRREAMSYFGAFLAGGALMALAMLAFNAAITGDPFNAPYTRDGGADDVLGFNNGFTFDVGLRNLQALLMAFLLVFNNWPAWVGLGFVALPFLLGTRNRWDYFCLVCALFVTGIYLFYRYSGLYEGPRYWYQAVPFLIFLTARGAETAASLLGQVVAFVRLRLTQDARPAHWAGLAVVYAFLAALVINGTGGWLFSWNTSWLEEDIPEVQNDVDEVYGIFGMDDRLLRMVDAANLKNALVLVKTCGFFDGINCYTAVALENNLDYNGNIVWARYIEGEVRDVVDVYPGRKVYVADFDDRELRPYDPRIDR
jgi:hypothetical protein